MADHGLSIAELARRCGTSRSNISEMLNGTRRGSPALLRVIAEELGMTGSQLKKTRSQDFTDITS